jgi:hypothetical protein
MWEVGERERERVSCRIVKTDEARRDKFFQSYDVRNDG